MQKNWTAEGAMPSLVTDHEEESAMMGFDTVGTGQTGYTTDVTDVTRQSLVLEAITARVHQGSTPVQHGATAPVHRNMTCKGIRDLVNGPGLQNMRNHCRHASLVWQCLHIEWGIDHERDDFQSP